MKRIFSGRSETERNSLSRRTRSSDRSRLGRECSKLDVEEEQALAEEGLVSELHDLERKTQAAYKYSFIGTIGLCLILAYATSAQSTKRDAKMIAYAKNLNVSILDRTLPKKRFESWLRSLVGSKVKVEWEINDCGEQTGIAGDGSSINPPLCAEANAELPDDLRISIAIAVGLHKSGITGRPGVWGIYFETRGNGQSPAKLSQLPLLLKKAKINQ
jgi:hypothetical protein